MVITKLYLYDSSKADYKGTDYSQYVLAGDRYTDDLTEVLDVCDLTLAGVPFSEEFDPTTKFIMEKYTRVDGVDSLDATYHLCVANDVVSQPILSDDNYFNHAITFNEPSVIAQGRIVDDCTETYKLKDVSLNVTPVYDPSEKCADTIKTNNLDGQSDIVNGYSTKGNAVFWNTTMCKISRTFRFVFGSEYGLSGSINDWKNFNRNQVATGGALQVSLPIPLIATKIGKEGTTQYENVENFCSTKTMVFVRDLGSNNDWELDTTVGNNGVIITNPSTSNNTENTWHNDWDFSYLTKGYILNRKEAQLWMYENVKNIVFQNYYKKVANFDNSVQNRTLDITILPSKEYKVVVTLNDIPTSKNELGVDNAIGDTDKLVCYSSYSEGFNIATLWAQVKDNTYYYTSNTDTSTGNNPSLEMTFNSWAESATGEVVFSTAPALSAYDLFIDAQLKSQQTWRGDNFIKSGDELPYYCNENDIEVLKNAEIVESAFHQKNFWEVLLEIGKYIHAIPFIKFGKNNRFLVTWRYLGQATQYENTGTTMSIFNSRSIENYVGALNSYVTNMVQLGGIITERIAPKSESDDYLVYADTAVLKTSKPIIEILKVGVECIATTAGIGVGSTDDDITDYFYENSIYELLAVSPSLLPNKGLALYYNLGENVIRGLNYQLPNINVGAGDTEYAHKRILGTVFSVPKGDWINIKINNFVFTITYRTKESVRSEQSRPDLRKYLINGAYEYIPQHKQFNNQQDVSVDSVKFGNQVYGKLIKTGNTEIQTTEWHESLETLKKAGQLINIRGNLYYVSKVTHTFFQDHIDSEVVYSKDYNQLSEIIGIPSEPRFYEISERNLIDRQVNINNYLMLGTHEAPFNTSDFVIPTSNRGFGYIGDLLFKSNILYPKYAITQFKDDIANPDITYPFVKELLHPISGYSMRNTLSLKWEMTDNFSAGDSVADVNTSASVEKAYAQLVPTQYVDTYGRADLIDFVIAKDISLTGTQVKNLPNSPLRIQGANKYVNYLGVGATYSQTGLLDLSLYPISVSGFVISTGSIKDSSQNVIGDKNSNVGDFVIARHGGYSAIYRCTLKGSSTTTWARTILVYGGDLSEYARTSVKASGIQSLFGSRLTEDDFGETNHGLALIKDNRERIAFNFNTQLLTDSDRFVLSGYMWRQEKKGTIQIALLSEEVNKIVNDTIEIPLGTPTYSIQTTVSSDGIEIDLETALSGVDMTDIKAIAIITSAKPQTGNGKQNYFIMARNVGDLAPLYSNEQTYNVGDIVTYNTKAYQCETAVETPEDFDATKWQEIVSPKIENWTISTADTSMFKKQ